MSVWFDGRVAGDGEIPLTDDRGLLLGDGLFETALVVEGRAEHLARHLARLTSSASILGITLPDALASTIASALGSLVAKEGGPSRGALRITVTRGPGRGLTPPGGAPSLVLGFSGLPHRERGTCAPSAAVRTVAAPRVDPRDPLAGHKTLSMMSRVHARRTARLSGGDAALLTTLDGDVCEADAANLFAVLDGNVVTPSLDRGVLPGITRARCLSTLSLAGRAAIERPITASELAGAGEIFLTSSLDGVRPVHDADGRQLGAPGPVARWLARCLEDLLPTGGTPAQNAPR